VCTVGTIYTRSDYKRLLAATRDKLDAKVGTDEMLDEEMR
jgi:hypothetical protein